MNLPRYSTLLSLAVCGLSAVTADASAREGLPGIPDTLSLNGEWRFHLALDPKAADEYRWFFEEGYDVSGWETIKVPSNWNLEGFEEPHYVDGTESEGFYVKTFTAPAKTEKDVRALLDFDGVWMSTEAWLNGKRLGQHDSGFTGFAFDVSEQIKWGEENTLSVRVRQQIQPDQWKFDANDDWALAGIYRDVEIEFSPREMVMSRVAVETDLDELYQDALLKTRIFVERWDKKADFFAVSEPFELRAILKDADGKEVKVESKTVTITGAHQGNDFTLVMDVNEPKKWTAETPNLYELTVELVRDGEVWDRWSDRIGFREVSTKGGVLRVNGQAVKLRGVARHDQFPDTGRATTKEQWLQDIKLMKAANINAVRTAHYPHAEGFIRLADEHGLYVIEEIPLGFGGDRFWNPSFNTGMLTRIHETMKRDLNRPSVIVWSFGNEDPFSALHLEGLKVIKGLDDTRPTLMPFRAEKDLPKEVDILAPHYWSAAQYDELAGNSTRPLVTTEYTHAIGPTDFGEFGDRWEAITKHPAGAGGMIWLWADQGLRRNTEGQTVLDPLEDKSKYTRKGAEFVADKRIDENTILDAHGNNGMDGIVDADRVPQRDYWETKAVYAPVQIAADWLPLNEHRGNVSIPVYNGYDFTDLSAVSIEWKLFRNGVVLDSGTENLSGQPHTTQRFLLPTTKIDFEKEGVHYAQFTIKGPDGSVMGKNSVRLGEGKTPLPVPAQVEGGAKIVQDGDSTRLVAGDVEFHFKGGVIEKAKKAGNDIIEDSDIAVWRTATWSERNRLDKIKEAPDWRTFLQRLEPMTLESSTEDVADGVVLRSKVEYKADEENRVVVDYTYHLLDNGQMKLDYAVTPHLTVVDWIPEVGVTLKIVDEPLNAEWLGEGVMDSTPGKSAATIFGQWDVALFSQEARGTKMDAKWVKVYDARGWGMYAEGMEAFRFDGELGKGSELRLLSQVAGSWTKNGPAERPERNIPTTDAPTYTGSVTLTMLDPKEVSEADAAKVATDSPAVLDSEFINPNAPYKSCHASTIAETSDGHLVAAWFGGTKERNPDVTIWVARMVNGQWEKAKEVATGEWKDGKRYPTWNPVLFQPKNGPLQLFYKIGPSPSEWWGMVMTSKDGGKTWSKPRELPEGILGPIKNKPVELADGTWLSPSSTEGNGWHLHFERSTDQGKTWTKTEQVERNGMDSIQPSVLFHQDGSLQSINRTRNGHLSTSWSYDQGKTWTATTFTDLPTPGSGTDAVTLQDGRQLLVYNHSSPPAERPSKGVRYPLDVAISKDGVHWDRVLTLESAPRSAGYAYPAVIQAEDGKVHITYTWDRDRIKHVVLDPAKL
ncbi:MAG: exo-alpha-sialidase [Verrucomicrobiota bacterium JB022]|nr:exo-alpha-sialidase [Verrucomicrobiota bacterium JB022]